GEQRNRRALAVLAEPRIRDRRLKSDLWLSVQERVLHPVRRAIVADLAERREGHLLHDRIAVVDRVEQGVDRLTRFEIRQPGRRSGPHLRRDVVERTNERFDHLATTLFTVPDKVARGVGAHRRLVRSEIANRGGEVTWKRPEPEHARTLAWCASSLGLACGL